MSEVRRERADAARNRRAILAATERLLAAHRPQDISMEQVAAAAGVGKGTVFHRFGNRTGLMYALMVERAQSLEEAVTSGPPPLGEGAPDRERLLAFLDAVVAVVARNKSLLAELGHTPASPAARAHAAGGHDERSGEAGRPGHDERGGHDEHPVYRFWHGHISGLIAAQRPDVDAETTAHLILGSLHCEPVLNQMTAEGPDRLAAAMRSLARALLDAPTGAGSGDEPLGLRRLGDGTAGDGTIAGDGTAGVGARL